jgi:hypothetical protein
MKFSLWTQHGALNSGPIFAAFKHALLEQKFEVVENSNEADVFVIWSVLWAGRMLPNQQIYQHAERKGIPVVILETGSLVRNHTWKVSIGNINSTGQHGNQTDLDTGRPEKLKLFLKPYQESRRDEIIIMAHRPDWLGWDRPQDVEDWIDDLIRTLKNITDRPIIVRPHPRYKFKKNINGATINYPTKIPGSYDEYDSVYNYHCTINYNTSPSIQSLIEGCPVICDESSLAAPLSNKIENIENLSFPDREDWFLKLCHTEWTIEEIQKGIPLNRIKDLINC